MKKRKFMKWAGVFVVALFFATTATVNATYLSGTKSKYIDPNGYWEDGDPGFPDQLPTGTSSLTIPIRLKAFDIWNGLFYDVGFILYTMRLRNGPSHFLYLGGQIEVNYTKDGSVDILPLQNTQVWSGSTYLGFDIIPLDQWHEHNFYMAHFTATIYKDLGEPELEDLMLYGAAYWDEYGGHSYQAEGLETILQI
jgi:hypothetical protein